MPDIRNYDKNNTDLKHADAEKAGGTMVNPLGTALAKTRKAARETVPTIRSARKRLPVVVDIILALLMVAMIGASIVGAYYIFKYFTVDYDTVEVEYTVLLDTAVSGKLKNEIVYCEMDDGNTLAFGKVISAVTDEKGRTLVTVSATVKYKEDEGYFLSDVRLAHGVKYSLRTEQGVVLSGAVVEIVDKNALAGSLQMIPSAYLAPVKEVG